MSSCFFKLCSPSLRLSQPSVKTSPFSEGSNRVWMRLVGTQYYPTSSKFSFKIFLEV
ncbi:mCG148241 [Mus musculus]|nr:mCG148241 [Mus musculus]